jgi:hypothetical protein
MGDKECNRRLYSRHEISDKRGNDIIHRTKLLSLNSKVL